MKGVCAVEIAKEEEPQPLDTENPWPGLMSFTEAGRRFFHGRDEEAAELARHVRRDLLTVLFGQSGLGKTSLLRAGLFPRLRAADFLPVYIKLDFLIGNRSPIDQIKFALNEDLAAHRIEVRRPRSGETLWAYFHETETEFWNRRNRLVAPVLVFDQFEEVFTVGRQTLPVDVLIDELAALIQNCVPDSVRQSFEADPELAGQYDFARENCKVVFALREDYLPDLEDLQGRMPSVMANRMRLTRMTSAQARDVVLKSGSHLVADGVAEKIVDFVAASRGRRAGHSVKVDRSNLEIEPAHLSIVCQELNDKRRRAGQKQITDHLLEDSGEEIVTEFYSSRLASLDPAVKLFIEEKLLTAEGDHRDSRPLSEALSVPGITREAIEFLVGPHSRILRIEERLATQRVELTHDLLIEVVRQQRDRRRERTRETQEAEERASAERERAECAELEASRQRQEREEQAVRARRWRRRFVATALTLLIAISALCFAIYERQQALAAKADADHHRDDAVTAKAEALNAKADADHQRDDAVTAKADAFAARDKAIRAERDLRIEEQELRGETWRARQQLTEDQARIRNLADALLEQKPAGAAIWHHVEWMALTKMGDHMRAVQHLDAVLNLHPDNLRALGYRGYEYVLMGRPEEARRDLYRYLKFGADPDMYTNLGIAEAMRRNYDAAIDAFNNAVYNYHSGTLERLESEVAPEIRVATRHHLIIADGPTFLNALRYEIAITYSFRGAPEFKKALNVADGADPKNSSNPYLLALNWSWLIARGQSGGPADYGAFAANGALWERAALLQPEAIRSRYYHLAFDNYRKFAKAHQERRRQEYEGLVPFVTERLHSKEISDAEALPSELNEPSELAAEAYAVETDEITLSKAIEVLEREHAERKPQGRDWMVSLYLRRAQERYDDSELENARRDAERVLQFDPHISEAHRLRADDTGLDDDTRRREYQQAIDDDPFNADALTDFVDFLKTSEPRTALELLQRRLRLVPPNAADYATKSRLQWELRRTSEALASVKTAIAVAIGPDDYERIARLQFYLGRKPEALVFVRRAIAITSDEDRLDRLLQLRGEIEGRDGRGRRRQQ